MVPTIDGVPVLLPPHSHPEFGDPGMHYHVDYRYTTDEPRQNRVIHGEREPVYVDLPMVRQVYDIQMNAARVLALLSRKYSGARASACGTCPHKGLPIMNGQCVGHGLCFREDGTVEDKIQVGWDWQKAELYDCPFVYTFIVPYDQTFTHINIWAGERWAGRCVIGGEGGVFAAAEDIINISF